MLRFASGVAVLAALCSCDSAVPPLATADPGVVFTFPIDGQRDVPLGTRVVVTFSDDVVASALGSVRLVGPDGPVDATPTVVGGGKAVELANAPFEEGATYMLMVGQAVSPSAKNLPAGGPLVKFTPAARGRAPPQ